MLTDDIVKMKCVSCQKEAEFDSPENYCSFHWTLWFTEGWQEFLSPEEYQQQFQELLKQNSEK